MQFFQFKTGDSVETEVKQVGHSKGAMYLAGGTTILDLMKLNILRPDSLIDISAMVRGGIEQSGDKVLIRAGMKMSEVAEHELIVENFPMVSEALLLSASPQIRNMATIGGNLLQRTRCSYYRDENYRCNKRVPGSGCDAIGGIDRMMAVLGVSEQCIATHPSDLAVSLAALAAVVHAQGTKGKRTIPIREFYIAYGEDPMGENVLQPGEMITAIELPITEAARNSLYLKVRDRASYEFALSSAAVGLELEGDTIRHAKIALGGVGTKPWFVADVESFLLNKRATRETFEQAATDAMKDAMPGNGNQFKIELCRRTLIRALEYATRRDHPKWYQH